MFRNFSIIVILLLFMAAFSPSPARAADEKATASPAGASAEAGTATDGSASGEAGETGPTSSPDVKAADEHLRKLWQDNASKYAHMTSEISELLGPDENLSIQLANVGTLMAEFNRFKLIFQTSAGHPSEQVEVLGNIKRLRQMLDLELGPLESNLNNLNLKLDEAESTRDSIAEMIDSGDPNIANYQKNITQAIDRLQAAQNSLTGTIEPIKAAIDTLDKSIAELNVKIPTIWNSYYFGDTGLGGVFQIQKDLFSWFDSFALRAIFMFPQDRDSRVSSLFRFIITLVIMSLVASIIITYQKRIPEEFTDLFSVFFKGPWLTMALGLALMAASMTQMGGSYLLLKLPGILLIIRALATVSWRLRIWTNPALKDKRSPLHRFYAPSALGVAFLFSDLPASAVTVVWLITMAFFLYYLNRFGKKSQEKPKALPEMVAYGSGIYFALGSLLVTILGYSRLAILVFMCLFALANILILGSALVVLTVKICDYVFNPKIAPIKNALANSLAAPCSFLLSLLSALPWLLGVPGSTDLFDSMMNRGYSVGSASISFYRIFFIIMLLLLFRSMGALANTSLVHLNDKFNNLKSGFMQSLRTLMNYIIWCLFAVIALSLLGVNFTSIILAATGFSVGISMGLQSIVNNLFSGLILILGGNVQIDNLIEVDGVIGKVVGINIRCTVLEPADNSWVYVPNSSLVNGRFINWTRNNRLVRRKIDFRAVYGTDIDKARAIMLGAAMNAQYAAKVDPFLPAVSVTDLSENAVILTLAVTILDIDQNASTQSELREAIYKGFNENGIGFYVGSSLDVNLTEPPKPLSGPLPPALPNSPALPNGPASPNSNNQGEPLVTKRPTT